MPTKRSTAGVLCGNPWVALTGSFARGIARVKQRSLRFGGITMQATPRPRCSNLAPKQAAKHLPPACLAATKPTKYSQRLLTSAWLLCRLVPKLSNLCSYQNHRMAALSSLCDSVSCRGYQSSAAANPAVWELRLHPLFYTTLHRMASGILIQKIRRNQDSIPNSILRLGQNEQLGGVGLHQTCCSTSHAKATHLKGRAVRW